MSLNATIQVPVLFSSLQLAQTR